MSFDEAMYERIREGCIRSAEVVCPLISARVQPARVADVGGGEGWWGRWFYEQAGCDVLVLDESVAETRSEGGGRLTHCFVDFENIDQAAMAEGHFDLALCLEVVEHVTEAAADKMIEWLCKSGKVVAFSAAIPGQGGHGHVNEQWPAYWAVKFLRHGYVCSEEMRWTVWSNPDVEPWYRQNLLVFGGTEVLTRMGFSTTTTLPAAVVHPDIYGWRLQEREELRAALDAETARARALGGV